MPAAAGAEIHCFNPLFIQQDTYQAPVCFFFNIYLLILRERERKTEREREGEEQKERERESQAGSMLSLESQTPVSIPRTLRS